MKEMVTKEKKLNQTSVISALLPIAIIKKQVMIISTNM